MFFDATEVVFGSGTAAWPTPIVGLDNVEMVRITCWNRIICHDAVRYMSDGDVGKFEPRALAERQPLVGTDMGEAFVTAEVR